MSERTREFTAFVPENVYKRIARDIRREKFVTPYMIAERYSMTLSLAKQVLRRLESEGVVRLYSPSRRAPLYIVEVSRKQ